MPVPAKYSLEGELLVDPHYCLVCLEAAREHRQKSIYFKTQYPHLAARVRRRRFTPRHQDLVINLRLFATEAKSSQTTHRELKHSITY